MDRFARRHKQYNGKEFFHFNDTRFYENCEPVKHVCGIAEDKNGDIWIGTLQGLYKYSQRSNTFKKFDIFPDEKNRTTAIFAAVNNEIWICDYQRSFKAFNIISGEVRTISEIPQPLKIFQNGYIYPQVDDQKNIWLAAKNIVFKINTANNKIEQFEFTKIKLALQNLLARLNGERAQPINPIISAISPPNIQMASLLADPMYSRTIYLSGYDLDKGKYKIFLVKKVIDFRHPLRVNVINQSVSSSHLSIQSHYHAVFNFADVTSILILQNFLFTMENSLSLQ